MQEPAYIQQALDDIDSCTAPGQIEPGMPIPVVFLGLLGVLAAMLLIAGAAFFVFGERSLPAAVTQVNSTGLALTALGLVIIAAVIVLAIKCFVELADLAHAG